MKKIICILLTIILSISWYINLSNDSNLLSTSQNYKKIADNYFKNGLYFDALDYYKLSNEFFSDNEINNKIYESYLKINKYDDAFTYLNLLSENKEIKTRAFLNRLLELEEYSKYNYFLKLVDKNIKSEFDEKKYFLFKDLKVSFDDIKYEPDTDNIFGKIDNCWRVINDKGKPISQKYKDIMYKDDELLTVNDSNTVKVLDQSNNLRSSIKTNDIYGYKDGYIIKNNTNSQTYIDRTGKEISKKYNKASNFTDGIAIIFDGKNHLIGKNFIKIKEIDGEKFKVDKFNNAIIDRKVIVKINKKYKMYDLETEKYSQLYDDIDFSYGQYIAIKKNGKWGYMNQKFEEIISPEYSFATSFNLGISTVMIDNNYFLIDKNKTQKFKVKNEIKTFNRDGIGFIRKNNKWTMVKLVRFIND